MALILKRQLVKVAHLNVREENREIRLALERRSTCERREEDAG